MALPSNLLDEFAKVTHDAAPAKENTSFYGTARFEESGDYVIMDGSSLLTPATYATNAVTGDRVFGIIKNHRAIITANITSPSMTLGTLKVNTGLVIEGYLTTNSARTKYNDQNNIGLTFSDGGLGAYGGNGKYWYVKNTGELYASYAEIYGKIVAKEGYIGTETNGFKIDQYGLYSGTKSGTDDGYLTITNSDFTRLIGGTAYSNLRFAIGGNFGVTAKGDLIANNVDLSGRINATGGHIGNFTVDGAIYSGTKTTFNSNNGGVYLGADGIAVGLNSPFKVSSDGALTATSATISGTLTADAGSSIGPWSVSSGAIYRGSSTYGDSTGVYFGVDGLSIKNIFSVDSDGILSASGANLTNGTITAGILKSNNYNSGDTGSSTSTYSAAGMAIDLSNSIIKAQNFAITNTGVLNARDAILSGTITATDGNIGGWKISNNFQMAYEDPVVEGTASMQYGVYVRANASASVPASAATTHFLVRHRRYDGSSYGTWINDFFVRHDGGMYASSGTLGPWSLSSDAIYRNSSTPGASGGLYFGTSGLSISDKFKVDTSGNLTLGSTIAMTWANQSTAFPALEAQDGSGNLISSIDFTPFGISLLSGNPSGTTYYGRTYTERLTIGSVGSDYNRAATTVLHADGDSFLEGDVQVAGNVDVLENGSYHGLKSVEFTRSLTSGTKIGTITIGGTATDIYCQTNTNLITGVKGNLENDYRTGNVNLTCANIGAVPLSGGTMTGKLTTTGLRISGHTGDIGNVSTANNANAVSLAAGTAKTCASITLAKGTWIVQCYITLPKPSSDTYVTMAFTTGANSGARQAEYHLNTTAMARVGILRVMIVASETTFYFSAVTGVAATISAGNADITAIRIL